MNHSGLIEIGFFENQHIRLVAAGEEHCLYRLTEINSAHTWINKQIINNAELVVEDLLFWMNDCFKSVVPRYFDRNKIFSADDIRESRFLCSDGIISNNTAKQINKFLGKAHTIGKYDTRELKHTIEITNAIKTNITIMNKDNKFFNLFIRGSKDADNIYNRFYGNKSDEDCTALTNLHVTMITEAIIKDVPTAMTKGITRIGPAVNLATKNKKHLVLLAIYEVMFLIYIKTNFIQYVTKWVIKHNPNYTAIRGDLETLLYKMYNSDHVVLVFNALYDFTAIIKILKLYDAAKNSKSETKQLVWLCSGGIHNKDILNILGVIFSYINDKFNGTQFSNEFYSKRAVLGFANHGKYINSGHFVKYVSENPEFGLKQPEVVNIDLEQDDKDKLISDFNNRVVATVSYLSDADRANINLMLARLNMTSLRALITMVIDKTLFKERQTSPWMYYYNVLSKLGLTKEEAIEFGLFSPSANNEDLTMNSSLYSLYVIPECIVYDSILPYTLKEFLADPDNLPLNDPSLLCSEPIMDQNLPEAQNIYDYDDYLDACDLLKEGDLLKTQPILGGQCVSLNYTDILLIVLICLVIYLIFKIVNHPPYFKKHTSHNPYFKKIIT